jgi:hypothetical protein
MKKEGALESVFSGMRNLSVRCVLPAGKLGPGCRLPAPRESCRRPCPRIRAAFGFHGGVNGPSPSYRTRWEERALPIVRDEFRPAIPRRVARQQSPLPLHRHRQHKAIAASGPRPYHRTVDSVLTVCLTKRGNPMQNHGGHASGQHFDSALAEPSPLRHVFEIGAGGS